MIWSTFSVQLLNYRMLAVVSVPELNSQSFDTIFFVTVSSFHLSDFILNCRSKDQLENLQILGHHNSPLCHIDLKVSCYLLDFIQITTIACFLQRPLVYTDGTFSIPHYFSTSLAPELGILFVDLYLSSAFDYQYA